jgi:hypothetical protein
MNNGTERKINSLNREVKDKHSMLLADLELLDVSMQDNLKKLSLSEVSQTVTSNEISKMGKIIYEIQEKYSTFPSDLKTATAEIVKNTEKIQNLGEVFEINMKEAKKSINEKLALSNSTVQTSLDLMSENFNNLLNDLADEKPSYMMNITIIEEELMFVKESQEKSI